MPTKYGKHLLRKHTATVFIFKEKSGETILTRRKHYTRTLTEEIIEEKISNTMT